MVQFIILAALKQEFEIKRNLQKHLFYTGIGKINAAVSTCELLISLKPKLVVNVGTAGSLNINTEKASIINSVIERDMLAMPLTKRGQVPFDKQPSQYFSDKGNATCATGDSFVTSSDEWLVKQKIDYVDMELFAIAKTCYRYGVTWRSIKYVSDYTSKSSAQDWNNSLPEANKVLNSLINEVLDN